jgi:hypothetical protein
MSCRTYHAAGVVAWWCCHVAVWLAVVAWWALVGAGPWLIWRRVTARGRCVDLNA